MEKNMYEEMIWKNKNQQYLFELQKFLDITDNVEEEKLRKLIIYQMLKCDKCLTKIAEKMFKKKEENI
ncbi:MAG: hypothetical protein HFJ59_02745 [Clostridia bacterium]|nr:hypothetical protein [Clostridia bacterium]